MKEKEKTKNEWYEYKHLRVCKHNIQRESCRKCLFENLCWFEERQEKLLASYKKTKCQKSQEILDFNQEKWQN